MSQPHHQQPSAVNLEEAKAYRAVYLGHTDVRSLSRHFPRVAAAKKAILSVVQRMPANLSGPALERHCLKLAGAPVPDGMYSDQELRDALVAYMFYKEDGVKVASIADKYGPSRVTLHRHARRLDAARAKLGLPVDCSRAEMQQVANALEFRSGGRPTLFAPDEERMLLELAALHAEHGAGKSQRLAVSFAKQAAEEMAANETTSAADAERLGEATCGRSWYRAALKRAEADGRDGGFTTKKPCLLSQTRAAAKKPGQNAAMFAAIQAKYDEHGHAGKLPGCQRDDGHWEPSPNLIFCGDEMGIEPNGKRWSRVLVRQGQQDKVHRVVTGEHNPFWVTVFFWSCCDGTTPIPPLVIHKAAQMRGDLVHGIPVQPGLAWLVRASESGYLTADDWYLVCAHFKQHIVVRPAYVQIDGYAHHWEKDALQLLAEDDIHVFFLKSQDSDSDQLNDNGPNASVKASYGRRHDDWLQAYPTVPFSPFFLNPLLVASWAEFVQKARPIIIRAAARCGISPFNPEAENFKGGESVSTPYDLAKPKLTAAEPLLPVTTSSPATATAGANAANPDAAATPLAANPAAATAATTPPIRRFPAESQLVVLQLKAAATPGTQHCVMRQAAVDFYEKSWVVPAQQLQEELKLQRELKKKTCPITVDRAVPPSTAVGLWMTPGVLQQLETNATKKEEKKTKAAATKETSINKKAHKRVAALKYGEEAEEKLRADPQARLKVPELQGLIVKMGAKPRGNAQDLRAHVARLLAGNGTPLLALHAPAQLALPSPPPLA